MPTLTTRKPVRKTQTQLVPPPPPQAFRFALPWLLGSLAATMATLIGQVPGWTLLTFASCTVWRFWTDRRSKPLPSLLLRVGVFIPMAVGVVLTYGTHVDAASMLAFLVALMSLKILELRSARDFTVVSLLGFFMSLSAFFYSQSLALALFLMLALFANVVALIRCHGASETRSPWPSMRLGIGMILQSLPLVALMFIIFPRVQATFLLHLSNPNVGLTGMSDHLQPGMFGSLIQSDDHAFHAQLLGGAALSQDQLYWRALALEVCESSMSWRAAEQLSAPPRQTLPGVIADRVEQRITVMPHGERWLFALDRPVELKPSSSFHGQLSTSDVLRSQSPVYSKTIYTVVSDLASGGGQPLNADRRRFYTKVPSDLSERARALARGWRTPGASDDDVVHAALRYLRDSGFTYSLNPGPLPTDGALDYFLFRSRKGFCEHYAAAFSSLMRAAGVPSRVVVGYQGGELNTWGKYYTVRQSDAHAWSEVWIEGRGWRREDPTAIIAPDRVSYGAQGYAALSADNAFTGESRLDRLRRLNAPSALRWLGHNALLAWDNLDQQWNVAVLGFDQDQQSNVLQRLGLGDLDILGGTLLSLATVFTVLAVGTAGIRFLGLGLGHSERIDPARRLYSRFCRRLAAAAGVVRQENEGPLDYARRATEALPAQAVAIGRITDLYIASRYAAPVASARVSTDLREAVSCFRPSTRTAG